MTTVVYIPRYNQRRGDPIVEAIILEYRGLMSKSPEAALETVSDTASAYHAFPVALERVT